MGRLDLLAAALVAIVVACAIAVLFIDEPPDLKCEPPMCLDSDDGWP